MCSKLYGDFPSKDSCIFLIPESQRDMFVAIQKYKPEVYAEIVEGVQEKETNSISKKARKTLVTIYGDYNDGHCPKELKKFEDFSVFPEFDVRTAVAPQVHNGGWITDSISVIAHH